VETKGIPMERLDVVILTEIVSSKLFSMSRNANTQLAAGVSASQ